MTRSRSELERVRDIREAIAAIWRYQAAVRRNPQLFPTGMLEQATMDNLMIIGEAANHLPEEIKRERETFLGAGSSRSGMSSSMNTGIAIPASSRGSSPAA